jgi:hypothetical protein
MYLYDMFWVFYGPYNFNNNNNNNNNVALQPRWAQAAVNTVP